MEQEKILFVDDDQNLLDSFVRSLGFDFSITAVTSGVEAIKVLSTEGPFAVIVSDMRMPGMDGVQLLNVVKQRFPETVRIMLTGNTDQETAQNAVNTGNIFRFLVKPCGVKPMADTLKAALDFYRVMQNERDLLEKTVQGSIKVLIDVLAFSNSLASLRAQRMKFIVSEVAKRLELPDIWRFETAAMLSQIGFATIPTTVLKKIYAGENLVMVEKDMLGRYPVIGESLIANIPRLEDVAQMIGGHQKPFDLEKKGVPVVERSGIEVGSELLTLAGHFDTALAQSSSKYEALRRMQKNSIYYNPAMLEALEEVPMDDVDLVADEVSIRELQEGMILRADVVTTQGDVLSLKGQEITDALIFRFENYLGQGHLRDQIQIFRKKG